ncbi:GntP family permease [Nocardioides sp. cx-173]|uniref:GntP family permease n=1 Tax=Nocardioides sp. cx-173 TaxID=2898796 RepID=UPI001E50504E|nr:GntP family permease [Nocardioides sp. cx-173]MCD4525459.1 GntP family permease [Nocardioides sp. cx-173]UGB42605.1 GntP family permease [Nocardioides sp. cx-173]
MEIVHSSIAILAAIVLIIALKIDPVISLLVACIYLGLATGQGGEGTVAQITGGFGEIMAEVGLLIGFGVLIGALLHSMGTFRDLVEILARRVGKRLPYAMAATLSVIFPSIYVDVQVVLAAPMAKESAPAVDRRIGLPWLAGAMAVGIFSGYVFVVPGLAAVAIAGLMDVPLGTYLIYGVPIGLATALITTVLFRLLLARGYWNDETDYDRDVVLVDGRPHVEVEDVPPDEAASRLPLLVRLLPILVPLVLIATAATLDVIGDAPAVVSFLGDANIALFIGLLIAFVMVRMTLDPDGVGKVLGAGFHTTGEILLVTGVGGSLGAVIAESGMDKKLEDLFSADANAPVLLSILLAWFIAAVLHFAIGSVSVGAITAAGIISPVVGSLGVDPVVIALAIASGAMFALHVNSNFFWMFSTLLDLSTKGSLKTLTVATSIGAVVSLPLVLLASLVAAAT